MADQFKYVLDTNVLIDAHRRYYAFDIAPGFWRVLLEQAEKGFVISIDRVKEELTSSNDVLSDWVKSKFEPWFMSTEDEKVIQSLRSVISWSQEQHQFKDFAKDEFAGKADSWLVAYAMAYNCTIVTLEQFNRDKKSKILIPVACDAFGIEYMNTFEMLRRLNAKLGE